MNLPITQEVVTPGTTSVAALAILIAISRHATDARSC
jgi:hypothetical protein